MKVIKGRLSSMPFIYKYFLEDIIMINLTKEKVVIFHDGTYKQTRASSTKVRG